MMKTALLYLSALAALIMLSPQTGQAQCKNFTKKKCITQLDDYTGNGQYNGAVMFEGEEAKLTQTFYSGKDYRLFVCAYPSISDSIYFDITDYSKNLLFTSKDADEPLFDFSVESTQQLNIKVVVPDMGTTNELKKNGCVSILVGFKDN